MAQLCAVLANKHHAFAEAAWVKAPVASHGTASVSLRWSGGGTAPQRVRYLWSGSPCSHPHLRVGNCSVYAGGLPATPFLGNIAAAQ